RAEPERGDENEERGDEQARCGGARNLASAYRDVGEKTEDPHPVEGEHDVASWDLQEVATGRGNRPDEDRGRAEEEEHDEEGAGDERTEQEQRRLLTQDGVRVAGGKGAGEDRRDDHRQPRQC